MTYRTPSPVLDQAPCIPDQPRRPCTHCARRTDLRQSAKTVVIDASRLRWEETCPMHALMRGTQVRMAA